MSGKRRWFAILALAALVTTTLGGPVSASAEEDGFLSKINSARASAGLPKLKLESSLTSYARSHTQKMMDADDLFHSSSSALSKAAGSGWSKVGENVGRGNTVDSLHEAFMNSSGHKKNILGPEYTHVGIGTGYSNDRLWVTVVFVARGDSTPATTEPAPTTSEESKKSSGSKTSTTKPATTTTTVPPTTTTTLIVGPDRPVIPGESCLTATRYGWMCHD